jgi:hypothetical protein
MEAGEASRQLAALEAEVEREAQEIELKWNDVCANRALHQQQVLELRRELEQCEVRASTQGILLKIHVQEGDQLSRGDPLALVAQSGMQMHAVVDNSRRAELHLGQRVRIKLDAYDSQRFGALTGSICEIAPDAVAQGPQGSGYPIRIQIDSESVQSQQVALALGLNGLAEILTERETLLRKAVRILHPSIGGPQGHDVTKRSSS